MEKKFCDYCQIEIEIEAVKLECWYGSKYDNSVDDGQFVFDFCSDKCCVDWVNKNLKEKKETSYNKEKLEDKK